MREWQKNELFTNAAPYDYSRNWLESRLAATLSRLLTGICNQPVEIRFVSLGE